MYDTVNISLTNKSIPNIDLISYLDDKLNNVSEHKYNNSNSITGYLKNLKCVVTKDKLQIKDSSISKFYYKHNFKTLALSETSLIFEEISDLLCLPVYDADVTRIDLATNFVLPYDLSIYFNRLGSLKGFERLSQSKGLYYNNSINHKSNSIQLAFYNKYAEYKDKGLHIPLEYNNPNTFRYELRYLKQLQKHLKQKDIKVNDLYNPVFYKRLTNNWFNYYNSIAKVYDMNKIDFSQISSTKDLNNIALAYFISQQGGINIVNQKLKEAKKINPISRKAFYDIKDKITKANNYIGMNYVSDFIDELDKAVIDFYHCIL